MAETDKKVVAGNPVTTPDESAKASINVRTVWPSGSFTVEGVPVITATGTMLTKTQFEIAQKAAGPSGVQLEEVND